MYTWIRTPVRLLTGLALLAVSSCGGSDSTGPAANLLHGNWVATKWQYTNNANAAQTVNITSASYPGGAVTVTLFVDSPTTGSYKIVYAQAGATQTITGTYTVSGNIFTVTETGASSSDAVQFAFSNGNNTLTMTDANSDWDFGSGTVPATLSMTLNRQ
jgi:hypothetical protein